MLFEMTVINAVQNRKIDDASRENVCLWMDIDLEERVAVHNLSFAETEIENNSSIDACQSGCYTGK